MKTQTKSHRKINSITPPRWTAYMAAAAASSFAGAGSAEAEIHYSGNVDIQLTGNARASLPLSNGASLVFRNIFGGFSSHYLQDFFFFMRGVTSGSAWEGPIHHWIVPLGKGENVSAGRFYSVAGNTHGIIFTAFSDGYFQPYYGTRGFIGFRFNTGNGTQYGWARIETKRDINYHAHETIKDYAWGDVGDAILTGQKHSLQPANANSVLGSLGQLAFGAQGLDAWRTQRTQTPTD
jgi:hypothetical protein